MRLNYSLLLGFALLIMVNKHTEAKQLTVGFYNLENLFDTIDQPGVRDEEFTPEGRKNWNTEKYLNKQQNMATAISHIGVADDFSCPDILGVCEVENKMVLEDLLANEALSKEKYEIIHNDSPDRRGIDVALLYKKDKLKDVTYSYHTLYIYNPVTNERVYTRDQLLVSGTFGKQKLHFIVNHWPSRYGGELSSRPFRIAAAQLTRHLVDSIQNADSSAANVIIMGDLNDDPDNMSTTEYLYAGYYADKLKGKQLFNTSAEYFLNNQGSLKYHGKWNLFDQLIISQDLLDESKNKFTYLKTVIVSNDKLIQQDGAYKGYPLRTFGGKDYLNGYSDHLPVYLILTDKK